jgi:hypothetical protein
MEVSAMISERIVKALRQEARTLCVSQSMLNQVVVTLDQLLALCGEASRGRQVAIRIGKVLMRTGLSPTILAPCCPDYSHKQGVYDFVSLGGGISLLAQHQIAFLTQVQEAIPDAKVRSLIADQEAEDPELCRKCGVTTEEFRALVALSVKETRSAVAARGWEVLPMTIAVPDFYEIEGITREELRSNASLRNRLTSESIQRSSMYERINRNFTNEEMFERTVRTAAQYLMLGRYASVNDMLVSNHTTTNLSWYNDAETATLHNPVAIY